MSTPYNPVYVANYIVDYAKKNGKPINNLKLQKILYFIQARKLVESDEPMFSGEIQKWKLGPVSPDVYHTFKMYGSRNINDPEPVLVSTDDPDAIFSGYEIHHFNAETDIPNLMDRILIEETVDKLIDENPFDLVEITHQHDIWKDYEDEINSGKHNISYTNDEIKNFFTDSGDEVRIWL